MRGNTPKFLVVSLLLILMILYISSYQMPGDQNVPATLTREIAVNMFSVDAFPLQVVALALVAAMLGGVFLAREDREKEGK
jgi:NADH:ubiquinone oxidoreductase subunit 6 (subunit J)